MDDTDAFFTPKNLKSCKSVFKKFMRDRYGVVVALPDAELRMLFLEIMKSVNNDHGYTGKPVKKLNDLTIIIARDVYMRRYASEEDVQNFASKNAGVSGVVGVRRTEGTDAGDDSFETPQTPSFKPNVLPLERERQVYGNRHVPIPSFNDRPQMTTPEHPHASLETTMERLMAERAGPADRIAEARRKTPNDVMTPSVTDADGPASFLPPNTGLDVDRPFTNDEYLAQMAELQENRKREDEGDGGGGSASVPAATTVARAGAHGASTAVATVPDASQANVVATRNERAASTRSDTDDGGCAPQPADVLIDECKVIRNIFVKNLSVNGFDRDWTKEPFRYKYTVRTTNGGMNTTFKDVTALQATCLVVPMDITPAPRNTANAYLEDKPTYQYEFGMPFPYVILAIEGLEGVYDGTNDNVRRAFCNFVYNKQYKTPNGRGFVILEPMQDEIKRFEPQPLASLRNLSISIMRPNGVLFNQSRDDYRIIKVEYESFNEKFLKVVLDKYFDKNEFYVGDTVVFDGLSFHLDDTLSTTPTEFALSVLEDYLNRREGHDIVHMEPTNTEGFRRAFHIYAPGIIDQTAGQFVINNSVIRALVKHNESGTDTDTKTAGHVLNASLQNVVTFKVWMRRADIGPMLHVPRDERAPVFDE